MDINRAFANRARIGVGSPVRGSTRLHDEPEISLDAVELQDTPGSGAAPSTPPRRHSRKVSITSSSRQSSGHQRFHDEGSDDDEFGGGIEMRPPRRLADDYDDDDSDDERDGTPLRRPPRAAFEIDAPRPPPKPRRLGGHVASAHYARKRHERDLRLDKLRVAAATPKAVEAALREQSARNKRRRKVKALCPSPLGAVQRFLGDPVTRFWFGCNVCCTLMLFLMTALFLFFLYPIFLQPILKY
jgi:hypothetical protein